MRSFLAPALFSSSCKAAGQEAIQFPLTHTHLHLELSHVHFAWGELGMDREPALASFFPEGIPAAGAALRASGFGKAPGKGHGGGLASSADQHLLQTSRNVSVASTTFTTRGAGRLWGALMDCKRLFPLCLLGSSPIPSGSEPHSGACAGTGAVGTRQGRLCLHLLASAPWSCCSVGSTRLGKQMGSVWEPACTVCAND